MHGGIYCWISDQWLYTTFSYALRGLHCKCQVTTTQILDTMISDWYRALCVLCSVNFRCVPFFRTKSSSGKSGPLSSAPGGGGGWSVSHMPSLSSSPLYLFPRSAVLSAVVLPPTLLWSCCHWGEHGGEVGLDITWSSSFCSSFSASSVMRDVQLRTSGLSSSVCLKANLKS